MVVHLVLASRTVTRRKKNPESTASAAQEGETEKSEEVKEANTEKITDNLDSVNKEETALDEEKIEGDVVEKEGNSPSDQEKTDDVKDDEDMEEVEEYYVKYRNFSYLHCEWKTEDELFKGDKRIASKLKRFKQKQNNNTNIFENVRNFVFSRHFS